MTAIGLVIISFVIQYSTDCAGKRILSFAGPFKTTAEKVYHCPETKQTDKILAYAYLSRPRHPKALQTITGNATLRAVFNNDYWSAVKLDVRNSNQWKENAFLFNFSKGACSAVRNNAPTLYAAFFGEESSSNGPCRLEPGTYTVDHKPVNWTFPNVPILPYGLYRFKYSVGVKSERRFCIMAECRFEPFL